MLGIFFLDDGEPSQTMCLFNAPHSTHLAIYSKCGSVCMKNYPVLIVCNSVAYFIYLLIEKTLRQHYS